MRLPQPESRRDAPSTPAAFALRQQIAGYAITLDRLGFVSLGDPQQLVLTGTAGRVRLGVEHHADGRIDYAATLAKAKAVRAMADAALPRPAAH